MAYSLAGAKMDDEWRGRYDILVTDKKAGESLYSSRDKAGMTLLEQNYAAQTLPELESRILEEVRKIEGVSVAAPVGFLGSYKGFWVLPQIASDGIDFQTSPVKSYRVTWQVLEAETKVLDKGTAQYDLDATGIIARPTPTGGEPTGIQSHIGMRPELYRYHYPSVTIPDENSVLLTAFALPDVATSVAVVDPVSEREILGSAGEWLNPLIEFDKVVERKLGLGDPLSADDLAALPNGVVVTQQDLALAQEARSGEGHEEIAPLAAMPGMAERSRPVPWRAYGINSQIFGYVANQDFSPNISISVAIESIDKHGKTVGTVEQRIDLAHDNSPFGSRAVLLPLPEQGGETYGRITETYTNGAYVTADNVFAPKLTPVPAGETVAEDEASRRAQADEEYRASFVVNPVGIAPLYTSYNESDSLAAQVTPQEIGAEITYRATSPLDTSLGSVVRDGGAPFEVGEFTPQETKTDDVPGTDPLGALGLYSSNHLMQGGERIDHLRSGLGVALNPPSAVVSYGSAEALAGELPINAIRVRVANLEGLTREDALVAIGKVADRIRSIGVDARVVAGSSLGTAKIWIPQTAGQTDSEAGRQEVEALGWVDHRYVVLGAADFMASLLTTLVHSIAQAGGFLIIGVIAVVGAVEFAARRTRFNVLKNQGWSSSSCLATVLREEAWGLILLACALVTTALFSVAEQPRLLAGIPLVCGAVIYALLLILPLRYASRRSGSNLPRISLLGWLTVAEGLFIGVFCALLGEVVTMIVWFRKGARGLDIGEALVEVLLPVLVVLAAAAGLAVSVLLLLARRKQTAVRDLKEFVYWNLGWSTKKIRTAQVGVSFIVAICCALVGWIVSVTLIGAGMDRGLYWIVFSSAAVVLVLINGLGVNPSTLPRRFRASLRLQS
ncbi:hypothetical protein [Actinotignum sp. GS-2025d]|uniref:hypothetical protein n=2 Tax=unclassified Actinotignum TaxID=2632702 RepID=UPI003F4B68EE